MKRSSVFVAAALSSALVFSGATASFASDSGSSSNQGSSVSADKAELLTEAAAARDFEGRHIINQTFQDAVLKAKTEFDAAMKLATTAEAKATALAARRYSVSSAIAARQNALTALEHPSKPGSGPKPGNSKR
ncbi:MAG: hypothetical protein Q7L55_02320 [Actinomycetota bacterium]|nr:hypothetical protein [Actinomycetota bacterium]